MLSAAGKSITSTTWHPPNFATDQPQNQHASCIFFPIPLSVAVELLSGTFNEGVSDLPNITENGAFLEQREQHGEGGQDWIQQPVCFHHLTWDE